MTDFDVVDALPSLSENDLREIKIRTAASKALVDNGFDAIDANNRINVVVDGTHHSVGADELLILLATTLWRVAKEKAAEEKERENQQQPQQQEEEEEQGLSKEQL